jgi:hypothetical protein
MTIYRWTPDTLGGTGSWPRLACRDPSGHLMGFVENLTGFHWAACRVHDWDGQRVRRENEIGNRFYGDVMQAKVALETVLWHESLSVTK